MAVEIACVLLLSTMLWDLSSGGKGGLQSHREPLSILGLAAVVVYFYISVFFYTRIESYSGKWYKSIITSIIPRITSITVSIIATVITTFNITFNTLFIISIILLIRTSFRLITTTIITSLIIPRITSFSKSTTTSFTDISTTTTRTFLCIIGFSKSIMSCNTSNTIAFSTTIITTSFSILIMTTTIGKSITTVIISRISFITTAVRTSVTTLFIAPISTSIGTSFIISIITSVVSEIISCISLITTTIITSFSIPFTTNISTTTRTFSDDPTGENLATSTTQLDRSQQRHRAHKSIVVHDGAFTIKSNKRQLITTRAHKSTVVHDGAHNSIHKGSNTINDEKILNSKASASGYDIIKNTSKYAQDPQSHKIGNTNREKSSIDSFKICYDSLLKDETLLNVNDILALNDFFSNNKNVDCDVYRNDKNCYPCSKKK
eukprot:62435_1